MVAICAEGKIHKIHRLNHTKGCSYKMVHSCNLEFPKTILKEIRAQVALLVQPFRDNATSTETMP